jgi:hypothetical protein
MLMPRAWAGPLKAADWPKRTLSSVTPEILEMGVEGGDGSVVTK